MLFCETTHTVFHKHLLRTCTTQIQKDNTYGSHDDAQISPQTLELIPNTQRKSQKAGLHMMHRFIRWAQQTKRVVRSACHDPALAPAESALGLDLPGAVGVGRGPELAPVVAAEALHVGVAQRAAALAQPAAAPAVGQARAHHLALVDAALRCGGHH
jgi:hypothetical protein